MFSLPVYFISLGSLLLVAHDPRPVHRVTHSGRRSGGRVVGLCRAVFRMGLCEVVMKVDNEEIKQCIAALEFTSGPDVEMRKSYVISLLHELLQVREQRNQLLRDMGDMAAELTRMAESLEMVLKMRETL